MADYTAMGFQDPILRGPNPYMSQTLAPGSGRPGIPEWISIGDPTTGLLGQPYMIQNQLDPRAMEAVRNEAFRTGPSTWANMARGQAANDIAASQAGQLSQAQNQLAMRGGLRTGSAERLASDAMRGGLRANQNAWGSIALQDEANRQNMLKALPGAELANAGYLTGVQNMNVNNAMREIGAKRASDLGIYNEQMRGWAAEQVANAVPNGADPGLLGGGGFLGTGLGSSGGILGTGWGGTRGPLATGNSFIDTAMSPVTGTINAVGRGLGIGGGK